MTVHWSAAHLLCVYWGRQWTVQPWRGENLPCSSADKILLKLSRPTQRRSFPRYYHILEITFIDGREQLEAEHHDKH